MGIGKSDVAIPVLPCFFLRLEAGGAPDVQKELALVHAELPDAAPGEARGPYPQSVRAAVLHVPALPPAEPDEGFRELPGGDLLRE